jgi:hypothetical protein
VISAQHCFNHPERLAAAQCLECHRSYCRECVTEHGGKLICAACLRKGSAAQAARGNWRRALVLPAMAVAALCLSWLIFYTAGWWLESLTAPAPRTQIGAGKLATTDHAR